LLEATSWPNIHTNDIDIREVTQLSALVSCTQAGDHKTCVWAARRFLIVGLA
jgi:hypothetical protein